ncbi:MAG: MarR family winged helix-turn-helix transcriptional regulator [Hyphomicrobiales bacterium]
MPKPATPPNGVHLEMPGHLLRRCHQIAVAIFMEECREHDLTPLQFVTLSALAHHGEIDHATLGGVAALDRTTVAVVVKNLAERRFVDVRQSDEDRRSKLIKLTHEGRSAFERALPKVEAAQHKILAPLSANDQNVLLSLLNKMALGNNDLSRAPVRTLERT